MIIDR